VLETLSPPERLAFVLHDVFAVPFDEIAGVLGTSDEAARQLGSRARRAVASGAPRRRAEPGEQRRVVDAFLAATRSGDFDALLAVLAPDAVLTGDGGGVVPAGRRTIEGAVAVARFLAGLFRRGLAEAEMAFEPVLVNGGPGLLVEIEARDGRLLPGDFERVRMVMALEVADGQITAVYNQLAPDKLTRVPAITSPV